MYPITKLYHCYLHLFQYLQNIKRTIFSCLFCLPSPLLALLLILLLAFNGLTVFRIHIPSSSTETFTSQTWTTPSPTTTTKVLLPSTMNVVKEVISMKPITKSLAFRQKRHKPKFKILKSVGPSSKMFSLRVREFLHDNSCKLRFFMTWIQSIDSFGVRESFAIESLFKANPNACLVIVSTSLDSEIGYIKFSPFVDKGFKLITVTPDFDYIFKNTSAEIWFRELKQGNVHPGDVPLGQNLSNLVRLVLLYKYGGIYVDTDVVLLKSFSKLRNSIGAQTTDPDTKNWSRLNNAVMIFDKKHPLLYEFIQEFSRTFDGNKWGHNGPYMVSRVASRVIHRPGFNFTVLPPWAFYPVDWRIIRSIFRSPKNETESKLLNKKLDLIRRQSFAVHLWNRQSRKLKVEEDSIIDHIKTDCCIFCNSSAI
ncbi:hypothetical protein ACFE04_000801 [Oxalis oulophora]